VANLSVAGTWPLFRTLKLLPGRRGRSAFLRPDWWGAVGQEIERKFLVVGSAWRDHAVRSERLVDGLLATSKGRKVRVRLYADRATIAIKTRKKGRSRFEFEYDIPICDAQQLHCTECGRTVLAKTRYYVPYANFLWEVDVYEPPLDGVVLAEVELTSADQDPPLPTWVGREVTEDPAFRKRNLFAERALRKFRAKPGRESTEAPARVRRR
jgi:CYTH domain-containing protein